MTENHMADFNKLKAEVELLKSLFSEKISIAIIKAAQKGDVLFIKTPPITSAYAADYLSQFLSQVRKQTGLVIYAIDNRCEISGRSTEGTDAKEIPQPPPI